MLFCKQTGRTAILCVGSL